MSFKKQGYTPSDRFEGYLLEDNPFPPKTYEYLPENLETPFKDWVIANEINRLGNVFRKNAIDGSPLNYWLLKTEEVPNRYNLILVSGLFRSMVAETNPQVFPVYANLPLIFTDVPKRIWDLFSDRFLPRTMRRSLYTYLLSEIASLSEEDARNFLPSIDVKELISQAEESDGKTLDDLFFPPEKELKAEELKTEEEEEPTGMEAEEEVDERAQEIISFLEMKSAKPPFSKPVYKVLMDSLRKGFEPVREEFQRLPDYKEALIGLLDLIQVNYCSSLLLIDQVDGWYALNDLQKAHFYGSIIEFNYLSSNKAFIVLTSLPRVRDEIKALQDFVPLNLDFSNLKRGEEPPTPDVASEMISSFLSADFRRITLREEENRKFSETFPFTENAITELCSISSDWGDLLAMAGKLIELGADQRLQEIDRQAVKQL